MSVQSKIIGNVCLRCITLGSKFLLILILAKYLEPSDIGLYGLFVVTVAYSTYPLGFEFYTFSSRQIVKVPRGGRWQILKNQLALHALLYVTMLPILGAIFYYNLLPLEFFYLFFILVVLEHLNQEGMRILIAMQHQLITSLALFIRQGVWGIATALIMYIDPDYRKLDFVLLAWCWGSAIALALTGYQIWQISIVPNSTNSKFDWNWIKNGMKIAFPLFLASLSTNFISTVDRYWYESLNGLDALGAYVLYVSIATSLVTFMDAGIFSFVYPRLLQDLANDNYVGFDKNIKLMMLQVLAVSAIALLLAKLFSEPFFSLMEKPVYLENINAFYLLLLAAIVQCFSYVPHFALYALEKDRHIVIANVASIPLFFIFVKIIDNYSSILAIPIGLCFISFASFAYKYFCFSTYNDMSKVRV